MAERHTPVAESGPSEIRTLARNFNQMNADLGRLDEDRALILAGISHDLRTPLARLRMGIEMVPADELTRDGMISDVEEMDRTIGQFLDFARAGQTEDNDSEMLATDITSLLIDLTSQYRRRNVSINAEIALVPPCRVRPQALRRAVGNLIDNALRYAGTTLAIDLTLKVFGTGLLIEIADRGPGIPEAEIERLKLPFTRLETARSNALGAGLGLAIVDRFARNYGGHLELAARAGGGLVASIFLPLG